MFTSTFYWIHHQIYQNKTHANKVTREKEQVKVWKALKMFQGFSFWVCFVFHEFNALNVFLSMNGYDKWFIVSESDKIDEILILTTIIVITQYTTDANCTN